MSGDLPRPFGNYSLVKLLAKGGMGEIYLARSKGVARFEKFYALKKLLSKFTQDEEVSGRFVDEARLGARLQHPNIVQVFDLGKVGDEFYMTTEFVDGFDLRRVLRFCYEKKKSIPLDVALFIVGEVLSGLAYAHRQVDAAGRCINLIHRDISPQNILVSFEGEVKIIDFGLAKSTQSSQETQANVVLGNFGYMSPEQARGKSLDVRADVYSAGVVFFELVTTTKRFMDENPMRLLEMVARPTPLLPSERCPHIPKAVDRIYAMATAPNPDERYQGAVEFRDDVREALHRLNPRAAREHLAQFLNHLFLGGEPLPPVNDDILNHSVAIQVQARFGNSDAFLSESEVEHPDRNFSGYSDDMPQTDSHDLMRSAREGDQLTHQELVGARSLSPNHGTLVAVSHLGGGETHEAEPISSEVAERTLIVASGQPTAPESTQNTANPANAAALQEDSWSIELASRFGEAQEMTQPGTHAATGPAPVSPSPVPKTSPPAVEIRPAAQPRGRSIALSHPSPPTIRPRARTSLDAPKPPER